VLKLSTTTAIAVIHCCGAFLFNMKNALLILPLLAYEWEKGKGKTITVGWLKWTYSVTW
jgi:hypothetical protein